MSGAALDLTFDQHRIDRPPNVVGHHIPLDLDRPRVGIDIDYHRMGAIRIGHVVGVEGRLGSKGSSAGRSDLGQGQ